MLMHAPGGAEVKDAPEGKSRCRALMAESHCRSPLLGVGGVACKGVFERQFERQLAEDWSSEVECPTWWAEELGDEIIEIDEQVVYESEVQFQKTCEGVAPHSKGYEDLDIEPLIERSKPFPEHEVEQEDKVTGVRWEEAPN
eukprot:Gb_27739 [translate_table: standard]